MAARWGRILLISALFASACAHDEQGTGDHFVDQTTTTPSPVVAQPPVAKERRAEGATVQPASPEPADKAPPEEMPAPEVRIAKQKVQLETLKPQANSPGAAVHMDAMVQPRPPPVMAPPAPDRAEKKAPSVTDSASPLARGDVEGGETYRNYGVNPLTDTSMDRLSTFSVDVDTASYAIARRKLVDGYKPPPDSVRVEEFLNYFHYDYASPKDGPLAVYMDAAPSPFDRERYFLRVGVQGTKIALSERKPAHLTFLVDVSGSMMSPDKLPLAKRALRILVDNLRDGDTVALVTYAGGVKDVIGPTGLEYKAKIYQAIDDLVPGGSTAMASGLALAYKHAAEGLGPGSNSRIIVMSDGDANVGPTSQEEIRQIISSHVKEGVTLSVVGFGTGNYRDDLMEQLADHGNGNYFYCDSVMQARRIFQEQLGGTIEVIAKDVKLQVEFDPAIVKRYRLIGYENRNIRDEDFRDDKVDAGEIGSGHTVTALYELVMVGPPEGKSLATVRIRAKQPTGETATEHAYQFDPKQLSPTFEAASKDLRFAVSVAGAAEIFRASPYAAKWSLQQVEKIARASTPAGNSERAEVVSLVERAQNMFAGVASR